MITIKAFVPSFLQKFNKFLDMEPFTLSTVKVLDRGGTFALAAFNTLPQVYGFPQCVWSECSPLNHIKTVVKNAVTGAEALKALGVTFEKLAEKHNQSGLGYQKEAEFVREYFLTCMKIGFGTLKATEAEEYFNRRWMRVSKGEYVPDWE